MKSSLSFPVGFVFIDLIFDVLIIVTKHAIAQSVERLAVNQEVGGSVFFATSIQQVYVV